MVDVVFVPNGRVPSKVMKHLFTVNSEHLLVPSVTTKRPFTAV